MSEKSLNWMKFGGLVSLAFVLGLLFAGLLDLPRSSAAQGGGLTTPAALTQATQTASRAVPDAQPLVQLSDAFAAVAEQVRPSVVFITSQRTERRSDMRVPPGFEQFFPRAPRGRQQGQGSGFIVSRDGYILTNSHVVEDADRVTVQLLDRRSFDAKVVGSDPTTDVAVVKIDARNLDPAELGRSGEVRVGEWVLAVGNPLGNALTFTVTSGIVSAKGRGRLNLPNATQASIQDFIQTDAAINPGNSGGPLINVRGEVIGINSAIASQTGYYSGYGFAIPIDLARNVMEQLIANGRVQRAALGVLVQEVTAEDARYVGLPDIRGVTITSFASDDSPARRAGLEIGDVIVAVAGQPVEYTAQLQQEVGFRKPGEVVEVEVARKGGVHRTVKVRLTISEPTTRVARARRGTPDDTAAEGANIESLGLTVEPVGQEWTQRLDLPPNLRGLVILEIDPDGPAADAPLFTPGDNSPDIITAVEGTPVRTEAELRAALRSGGSGGVVTLSLFNAGYEPIRRIVRVRLRE